MDKPPPHRLNIWALAGGEPAERQKPSAPPPPALPVVARHRPSRNELLYADLGAPPRSSAKIDEPSMLTSLYDHRLPIEIELPGRATMPNGRSTTCKTKRISSESVELVYDLQTAGFPIRLPEEIPSGSTVHLDVQRIGNFHGVVTSQSSEGFQLAVDVECKGMLITKLAQVAAAIRNTTFDETPLNARRNITRVEPTFKACSFTDDTGHVRKGKIINISPFDALIKAPFIPPISTHIVFGGRQSRVAEVIRTFEIGFAVQFCEPIPENEFSAAMKFIDE